MNNSIHITLLRHARSRADDEQVHEGRYDSPLTDAGRAQVRARVQDFLQRGYHFDAIIASTLQRAHETGKIIGLALSLPVETDPDWMEMDNGPLQGLSHADAEARFPRPSFRNPYEPLAGIGESEWQLYTRAAHAVEKVIRRGPGNYLVVAHGGVLNMAMRCIVGSVPQGNYQGVGFHFGDTGYARLEYRPAKHIWVLREFTPGFEGT